jgi:DHA1 family bicyclomycin/chloramphenicol resistance-like MFS transporter
MSHPHIATLIMATAFGPVAMNLFLPSMPSIAHYFETEDAVVQLAVSLYLAATAVLQLAIGPLSDRYGRRPILLVCIIVGLIATLGGIYAPTIEIFLAARIFQGTAIAGMVISRAAIRDMVDTDEAASRIGYVTMAMALAPMIGPVVGGYLAEIFGWQATFWLIFGFGLAAFCLVWADMGETIHSLSGSFRSQLLAYPELIRSRRFLGYALTTAFASGAFFSFVGGSPFLANDFYHLPESHQGYYFALVAAGYVCGNYLSGRYSRRFGINPMSVGGGVVSSAGMLLALLFIPLGWNHPIAFYGPAFSIGIGNGMTMPNATAGLVSARPRLAGSASGLGGFIQLGGGAFLSGLAAQLLGPESGPLPLVLIMLVCSLLSMVTALYVVFVARSLARAEQAGLEHSH